MVIASGYIINNFYDAEKDLINKPRKSMLDRLVSQRFKLTSYFVLNFFAVFAASYVSFRAVFFFSAYIFGIWFYSHKLKKMPFKFDIGYMYYFFAFCVALLLFFLLLLPKAATKKHYIWLHNILKLIIVTGVFSILLIDVDLVLNRIL